MRTAKIAHRMIFLAMLCGSVCATRSLAQESGASALPIPKMVWGVKIPMRDGVMLNATIFQPLGQKDPVPVIFTFTPYVGDSYTDRAMYFAQHGYVYALVDVRGRGNSGGAFEPFANDAKDGYDIVEWLAKQPYCNGKVTMWGGSYAGFDQWTTLKEFPPHLATIVPAAAAHPGVDFPFEYNIFAPYEEQWLSFTSGVTGNTSLFGSSSFWAAKAREYYDQHRAFQEYDGIAGNPSAVFQKWMRHPIPDAYYDAMVPSPEEYKRIQFPILTITGHYDGDQPGAFTYYKRHMEYGTIEAKQNHYLIIGPWDHAGTRTPRREVGGLKFGEASVLDLNHLHTEWYDWTMKSGKKPEFLKKRVAYYVVGEGAENWKYADSLENISNEKRTLYLGSSGNAESVFQSGTLKDKSAAGASADKWIYDPLDTRPGDAEVEDDLGLTSQRAVMNTYGNGVIYHSEPFSEATEITGFLKLTIWLAMDVPDTDLEVNVYEILPGGSSVDLTSATMRARYRESLRQEKLVTPGKTEKYVFDNFTFFSRRIAKGSRLRLFVHCPNSTAVEKNYNSGGVVALETAKDAKTAHITLAHDTEHPSALELPVVK
ncbi:MAG TPA: CocE/NonD family hydrolase [Verrucomicrobiae bacterium]|jgi:putative CocE/NonD family hydrolase|nr:CocE/NonD family hydrolase [Verrucomicrobiae bacterium]